MTISKQLLDEKNKLFGITFVSKKDKINQVIPEKMLKFQPYKQKFDASSIDIAIKMITYWIANEKNVLIGDIYSNKRYRKLADARHILFFLLYFCLPVTQVRIGIKFNKHHTIVVHSIKKVNSLFLNSLDFDDFLKQFSKFYFSEVIK